jgi:hypothetical protein
VFGLVRNAGQENRRARRGRSDPAHRYEAVDLAEGIGEAERAAGVSRPGDRALNAVWFGVMRSLCGFWARACFFRVFICAC